MPYYRIIVIKQNGLRNSGIRHFPENLTYKQIEQEIWQKAKETIGRLAIADILITNVPADHPDVVAFLLRQRDAVKKENRYPFARHS